MPALTSQTPALAHSLAHRVSDLGLPLRLHTLLERVHDVDDLGCLALLSFDLDLWGTLLDFGLHKLVHSAGIFVRHLLRLELARVFLDEVLREWQAANAKARELGWIV
jgi:hypothetical protein